MRECEDKQSLLEGTTQPQPQRASAAAAAKGFDVIVKVEGQNKSEQKGNSQGIVLKLSIFSALVIIMRCDD